MIRFRHLLFYLAVLGLCAVECGCRGGPAAAGPRISTPLPTREPAVRVRVRKSIQVVSLASATGFWVGPPTGSDWAKVRRQLPSPLTITRQGNQYVITQAGGQRFAWGLTDLMIVAQSGEPIRVDGDPYPNTLVLIGIGAAFDVINHVKLETYLPGVLDRELFSKWHPTAFRTQAIAARSYALYQCALSADRHYDVEATTASQVYGGAITNRVALEAVQATAGMVLIYEDRIVCAYFSSCCGGVTQDGYAALAKAENIEPLHSRHEGGWCQQSQYYRWGPITRRTSELGLRLAAWGRASNHPIAGIQSIRDIAITKRTEHGRPTQFQVTDSAGNRYLLTCEQFRFACNQQAPTLADVSGDQLLRSSFVTPKVAGEVTHFTDGRGFGHGVGLCQWGMQAMASHGYSEYQILATYYQKAKVKRLY